MVYVPLKSINTLVPDIYQLLQEKGWYNEDIDRELSSAISRRLSTVLGAQDTTPTLRLSKMGDQCPRALWYSIHHPECAEPLPAWARLKYNYGHIIEALVLVLAKASGHRVEGEQDELIVNGIVGHRDAVIDGCVVDVKAVSSRQMEKFKRKTIEEVDDFGYLYQLDGYLAGSAGDDLVTVKDKAYILAIDKTLGHIHVYEHSFRPDRILRRINDYKRIVERSSAPDCTCETRPAGRSGNVELGIRASYSPFKFCCFPNLRTFLYSDGPSYLVHVARTPDVPEITREGRLIHENDNFPVRARQAS